MVLIDKCKQACSESTITTTPLHNRVRFSSSSSSSSSSSRDDEDSTFNHNVSTTKQESALLCRSSGADVDVVYYADPSALEERSDLYSTPEDLKRYARETKESIAIYRVYGGDFSSLDENKYCSRGLEKHHDCEDDEDSSSFARTTKRSSGYYYANCVLRLQDEFHHNATENPKKRRQCKRLISAIRELNSKATTEALERALEDRFAADRIYQEEDTERRRRGTRGLEKTTNNMAANDKVTASRVVLLFAKEPQPRIRTAMTA